MKTYTFKVVVEPDAGGYHAYCPALRHLGAITQGATEAEALTNINEVVRMIVDELREDGKPLPEVSTGDIEVFDGPRVVDPDDVLTPKEASIVRLGEAQLKRGESKPWRTVTNELAR